MGLDQSGKTTLFQALTESTTGDEKSLSGKRDANLSIVKVPDPRLDRLHELYPTAKKVQATIEYLDVGGLSKGSTQRKGFQEQLLANLRNVDALLCVLRAFDNEAVPHTEGGIDAKRDWRIIEEEFLFSDMAILETRIDKLSAELRKTKNKSSEHELALLQKCFSALESEQALRELELTDDEKKMLRGYQFLTAKPTLLVVNINEEDLAQEADVLNRYSDLATGINKKLVALSVHIEMELCQLADEDRESFQKELGILEPALNKMIRNCYDLLGLIPFFTAGDKEVRAWTIQKHTRAQDAAGEIHSDIQRGFIRAEVVDFNTLSELGSLVKCKEQGVLRLEGKDYIVQDGDVITFRFNV
ncbi:MAG: redox-regulated ATPase YchF [bacterium]